MALSIEESLQWDVDSSFRKNADEGCFGVGVDRGPLESRVCMKCGGGA